MHTNFSVQILDGPAAVLNEDFPRGFVSPGRRRTVQYFVRATPRLSEFSPVQYLFKPILCSIVRTINCVKI
jgi:hypothetical protein